MTKRTDRERRDLRLSLGLCYRCGKNPHIDGRMYCQQCKERYKAYYRPAKDAQPVEPKPKPVSVEAARLDRLEVIAKVRNIRVAFWDLGATRQQVVKAFSDWADEGYVNGVIDYKIEAGIADRRETYAD